jgi:hypothetical protein
VLSPAENGRFIKGFYSPNIRDKRLLGEGCRLLPLQRAMAVAIKGDAIKSDLSEVLEAGPPMLGGMNFSFV